MQVDLDAIELRRMLPSQRPLVEALVAELRAAREVVEAARAFEAETVDEGWHLEDCTPEYVDEPARCIDGCPQPRLQAALAAYHLTVRASRRVE